VLVTANDYRLGLFNGDQGVVVADASGLRVAFPDRDGVRLVAPSRLAEVQTVYALSVHKSQGSEFDRVAVWLPDDSSPLLTRELLYTAVTRAKQQVVVVGDRAALARAISTPVQRMSGLAARLVA
jgi:exodeoxyribonuclease V alpha subunit